MKNKWLEKKEEKKTEEKNKNIQEVLSCWPGGLWDWQQNAIACYLDEQESSKEK